MARLTAMVANLTYGKKGMKAVAEEAETIGVEAQALKDWFTDAIDADTEAFQGVMAAFRLPKDTAEQQEARARAIEDAQWVAIDVPRRCVEGALKALDLAGRILEIGNPNAASDAACGAACALAAAESAANNVLINLKDLDESPRKAEATREVKDALVAARDRADAIATRFRAAMGIA